MRTVPFRQVDVFTIVPFKGNPVAVVLEGDRLSTTEMQAIASWTNLSEATFVCAPSDPRADYRLRIFTPKRELAFAGHPTIGSAHAVLARGLAPKTPGCLVQECGKGLIKVAIDGDRLFFAAPTPVFRNAEAGELEQVAASLGIAVTDVLRTATIDVGPVWFTVQMATSQAVTVLS